MGKYFAFFCLAFLAIRCDQQKESEPEMPVYDAQYLPDGVEVSKHRIFRPDGSEFQGMRIDPPFWWTGMHGQGVLVVLYDKGIGKDSIDLRYPGVSIARRHRVANPNYQFLELEISERALPGTLHFIRLADKNLGVSYPWQLRRRLVVDGRIDPVGPSDIVYLIMPDRFANGDSTNDNVAGMRQTGIDRSKMYFRHGGDLQGITQHIPYLQELGVTALWLNPVLENDQPYASYHGYANTDHYAVDRRFGGNSAYRELSDALAKAGMKLVKDIVPNHCGDYHWFIRDIPDSTWIHQFNTFTRSNHAKASLVDPHVSSYDRRLMQDGWFDYSMPDLNLEHPLLAKYLIQSYIWWIEEVGLDGFRIDTYPYASGSFMEQLAIAVRREYPGFAMFGETWVSEPALLAEIHRPVSGSNDPDHFIPVKDFPLCFAIQKAVTAPIHHDSGIHDLYRCLAMDFVYPDPNLHLTFLDNHDMDRFMSVAGGDPDLWKAGITLLLTLRGIPSLYYGTELQMAGVASPDGLVRQDFPGGWPGDPVNKFYTEGRSAEEEEGWNYVKSLTDFRKKSLALQEGTLIQFAPQGSDGIYAFVRKYQNQQVFVFFNKNPDAKTISLKPYRESLGESQSALNILTEARVVLREKLHIPGKTALVLEVLN